jgi:hypothetical protein
MAEKRLTYTNLIAIGSLVGLMGFVLSGPVAFVIVKMMRPQPAWTSAKNFADHYHVVQDIPYYFGFLLLGGMLMVSVGHYLNFAKEKSELKKFHLLVSFGWTIAFFTLITFNYICQTTFVRNLALHYKPDYDAAIEIFSMSNPLSLCWANEMWGYAFLGVSTWLAAGYYEGKNNLIKNLMIINGVVSVGSALWTVIDVDWVMTLGGLISYFAWNVLMIVLMILIYTYSRKVDLESHDN